MKTKFTRMISLMLTLVMCFSMLNITAFAVGQSSAIQIVEQGGKVYYFAEPQEGEVAGEDNFDVWTSKTIAGTENEDEFEITLQVGTTMKAVPNDVAVVLVVDVSGSMMMDKNGKKWGDKGVLPTDGTKMRIDYAREAALGFAEALAENSGSAQRMLSVVEFGNNARTILPWTDANDKGSLNKNVRDAISAVDVNFVVDNRSFWDEEFLKTWNYDVYNALIKDGGVGQRVQAENWSDELYTHETKSFFEATFAPCDQSFMTEYTTTLVTETEEGTENTITRCVYEGCSEKTAHTHCAVDGCTDSATHSHCTYVGCASEEAGHTHCTYKGCKSTVANHNHCSVCGVSDAEAPDDTHCTYEGCQNTTAGHTHCTYSICANPSGHKHCERRSWCEENHAHCWDIQDVCGRTDEHQHIIGCTVFFCQDTTPGHKHGCVHSGITNGSKYTYPFYDHTVDGYQMATVRCLNSDPTHTHDVYDGDTDYRYMCLDRDYQKFKSIGTNMEGGLLLARNLVNAGQAKGGAIEGIDDVYVIILSDGGPTYHVNQSVVQNADAEVNYLPGERGGGNYATWDDVADIVSSGEAGDVAIAEDIKAVSDFYAILYGTGLGETLGGSHQLSGITGEQWFKTENGSEQGLYNYIGADAVFNSLKADELNIVFPEIKNRIDVLAKAWTVNDELSSDVTFGQFVENGQYAGFTPASGDKEAAVSWSLGAMKPECGSGTVSDPYIYTLKYTVQLNSAKDNVKEISLAYDANSDSVVSLPGVWTGTNTQLQYLMLEKEQLDTMTPDQIQEKLREAAFEDVSVKGLYADYEFIKKNKETDEIIEGAGFTLYDADGKVYGSEVFSDSEGKVTFTDIPKGEYTMKETTVPSGMQQMSDLEYVISWGMIATKNGGEMDDVIYNIPIPIPGKINIFVEKVWNDSNDVNGKRPESITVQLMANGNAVSDKTLTLNAGNNWSGSFDNLDEYEGDIEIVYTIAEVEVPEGYESVITGDAETGFTVTNTYVTVEEDPTEPEETESEETEPEDVIEIPDEDVPRADVPKTGDPILQYVGLAITSGVAAILVGKIGKKKEDEE